MIGEIAIIGGVLILLLLIIRKRKKQRKDYWVGETRDEHGNITARWIKPKSNPKIKIPIR